MIENQMNLKFELTCCACPEQYDVYNTFDTPAGPASELVAYVRLRWGNLTVHYPDVGGELIYEHHYSDNALGLFPTEEDRVFHFQEIEKAIYKKIAPYSSDPKSL